MPGKCAKAIAECGATPPGPKFHFSGPLVFLLRQNLAKKVEAIQNMVPYRHANFGENLSKTLNCVWG